MTAASSSAAAFATAMAAIVRADLDVADVLARLLADCAEATSSGAVAVLAHDHGHDLALLGATSHRAAEIDMLQAQQHIGPCVDAITDNKALKVSGADVIIERWGDVGRSITDAGFVEVESFPLTWRGQALGALNLFRTETPGSDASDYAQAFADVATLVIVQSVGLSDEQVRTRMYDALTARAVVEQAKGVIAYVSRLDLEAAYDELLRRTTESELSLTQVAEQIVQTRR